VRDLCRTNLCKDPSKSASLPCPFKWYDSSKSGPHHFLPLRKYDIQNHLPPYSILSSFLDFPAPLHPASVITLLVFPTSFSAYFTPLQGSISPPSVPYVFGPPWSGSVSQRYGSSTNSKKNLDSYQCCGSESESGSTGSTCFWASRIRIH
jgi:hypothetical protein